MHIGIASGQVVASRGAGHKAYSITGNSVNLASRLTDQAAAGTILVSEPVRRLLADRLDHVEVDAFELKGMEAPVRAFRVSRSARGAHGRAAVRRPPRSSCNSSRARSAACRANGRGQAVHIRGEAGIGKTRLRRGAAAPCDRSRVRLPQGAGPGFRRRRRPGRDLLARAQPARACARQATRRRRRRDRSRRARRADRSRRRVFLNDLLDLPQPTALRALYDAMDNRRAQARQSRMPLAELVERASRRGAAACHRRGHPLGGRPDARPSGAPGPDGRRRARGAGHDLAPGRRSARPGLALEHRRQPAFDPRPRPPARRRGQRPGARLRRCQRRARPALRRPGCRQPAVPRPAAAPRRGKRRGRRARLGPEPGPGAPRPSVARRPAGAAGGIGAGPALHRRMRSAICSANRPTTAPISCAICWCGRSATSSCSATR